MCRSGTEMSSAYPARGRRAAACAVIGAGLLLAGCSDLFVLRHDDSYVARRDTIALSGGDSVAGNTITQMVDPWPPYSGDRNIAFNGQKMQAAVARYRTGKVIEPVDPEEATSNNQSGQSISTTVNNGSAATTSPPGQ